ncbi:hypothetical protein MY9_0578 [Bacillus sp. JS]|nr:hypothetical protein MY9_0578 [Bacillus sp. JS]
MIFQIKHRISDPNIINNADFVVTLCGVQQINWGFDDPAKAHGTEDVFPKSPCGYW